MGEKNSRLVVLAEAILFLLPVTALTVWFCVSLVGTYQAGIGHHYRSTHLIPALAVTGLACQVFGWWAVGVFVLRGREGLARLGATCLAAIHFGALMAAGGAVALVMVFWFGQSRFIGYFLVNAVALPALVPYAHVMIEHRRSSRGRANDLRGSHIKGKA